MAVRAPNERQAGGTRQLDRPPIEIDAPRVEVRELDRVENVDLAEQSASQRILGGKEGMGGDHQPLGGLVSPQIGERPQHGKGHIEVVDQDVAPLDGGLRSRDEDDPPIGRIVDQPLAERTEIVVGDAEDVVAFARRAVDEGRGVVGDAGLTLAGVQMEVDLQPAGHSTVTLLARLRGWSTSQPRSTAMWYARSWRGSTLISGINKSVDGGIDRKSTRLNSSHVRISYAVFCLKK